MDTQQTIDDPNAEINRLVQENERLRGERDALLAACKSALSDHKAGFYSLSQTTLQRIRTAIRKAKHVNTYNPEQANRMARYEPEE